MQDQSRILITGGCGFIGCALVRQLLSTSNATVINVDKLTYAASLESLGTSLQHPSHVLERVDICDRDEMERVFRQYHPHAVMHLAAESHVDRSIDSPASFVETNIIGTYTVLEVAREFWAGLSAKEKAGFRMHHVSTDEVYGDLSPDEPAFSEITRYAPSSPYSSSKASSDHLVRAWHRTYGLPVLITNCSNNYGPFQFPEKLVPLMILNALEGKPLPIYGAGDNIRDWLYVEDHVRALRLVLGQGQVGRTYNIGSGDQRTNLEVVRTICERLDELLPDPEGPYERLISFVTDRPGHDRRYAIDNTRISDELGWAPEETFASGINKTVTWYLENDEWVDRIRSGKYLEWLDKNYGSRGAAG